MKYLKRFLERVEESDLDYILDILQYVGETTPKIWEDDFVRFSDGVLVVYFEDCDSKPDMKEIEDCQSRLMSNGYRLISYDLDSTGLWFLVMTKELESKYRNELGFYFIDDLELSNLGHNSIDFNGDTIYIEHYPRSYWSISDSITNCEYVDYNRILANISLLKIQHKIRGIQQSLSRRF